MQAETEVELLKKIIDKKNKRIAELSGIILEKDFVGCDTGVDPTLWEEIFDIGKHFTKINYMLLNVIKGMLDLGYEMGRSGAVEVRKAMQESTRLKNLPKLAHNDELACQEYTDMVLEILNIAERTVRK